MVAIKIVAVLFFLAAGTWYVEPANWTPFMPYAMVGRHDGAAVVFFAYIGFDAVSTTAEEAKNPRRDLPIGIIASLIICTVLYVAVAAVLTGIVPVVDFRAGRAVPERAGRIRAVRDQPGLGGRPGVGGRGGGHHERAAGHADEPAAHLFLNEPRRTSAAAVSARCIRDFKRRISRRSSRA